MGNSPSKCFLRTFAESFPFEPLIEELLGLGLAMGQSPAVDDALFAADSNDGDFDSAKPRTISDLADLESALLAALLP